MKLISHCLTTSSGDSSARDISCVDKSLRNPYVNVVYDTFEQSWVTPLRCTKDCLADVEKRVMEPISVEKAMEIAKKKGIKPGRVKGTNGIQFTKGRNSRLEIIDWDEFKTTLSKRRLAVYESGGWMKIMKK